ncbi:MAG: DUF1445 domain-containing protein [Microvirga sp.]|nr:DUF1445 domain-containing protein [Microvirga sp.]
MLELFARAAPVSTAHEQTIAVGLNMFVMPSAAAHEFLAFCYANYSSGSVVDFSDRGSPLLFAHSARAIDVRRASRAYEVMRGSERVAAPDDLVADFDADHVAIGIGCSVVVDEALLLAGVTPKHKALGLALPAYRTDKPTRAVGRFSPPLHVSMRIVKKAQVDLAIATTAAYPALHGAPIHVGDPAELGIADLARPLFGAGLAPDEDETCMFWGCGVTLRAALNACPDLPWLANAEGSLVDTGRTLGAFRAAG